MLDPRTWSGRGTDDGFLLVCSIQATYDMDTLHASYTKLARSRSQVNQFFLLVEHILS